MSSSSPLTGHVGSVDVTHDLCIPVMNQTVQKTVEVPNTWCIDQVAVEGAGAVGQMKMYAYSFVETFTKFHCWVTFTPDGRYNAI